MISEASRDTEDWTNDVSITEINNMFKYIQERKQLFWIAKTFHNITVFVVFWIK